MDCSFSLPIHASIRALQGENGKNNKFVSAFCASDTSKAILIGADKLYIRKDNIYQKFDSL